MKRFAILLYILSYLLIINQKSLNPMDLTIDFTKVDHLKVVDLEKYPYLNSITFEIEFFQHLNSSFACLYQFITYLNDKPLVKIFVKPKGFQHQKPKYGIVAVGGTFDHLHIGHQMLLLYSALSASKKLIIGITSEQMLKKKINNEIIQSYLMRANQVRQFIKTFKPDLQLFIAQLSQPCGPTITDADIQAIIVSDQTLPGAQMINSKRKQKGIAPLIVQVCPIICPISHLTSIKTIQNKISSTHLRGHILSKNHFSLQTYSNYQQVWLKMIAKINQFQNVEERVNHLVARKWWDIIIKDYSQYWRYYHTNYHINILFTQLSQNQQLGYHKLNVVDQIALQISVFFHDLIYRPDLSNNQQESASLAVNFINQIWTAQNHQKQKGDLIDKVKKAIISTKTHKPQSQVDKILCEIDMSILDSTLQQYKIYASNIEKEYRPVCHDEYPIKRLQFLNKIKTYKYLWREGENLEDNIKWEIQFWNEKLYKE